MVPSLLDSANPKRSRPSFESCGPRQMEAEAEYKDTCKSRASPRPMVPAS